MSIGLVLEGGAMRGVFTAGVLDLFLDKGIEIQDVYGVSAGASQAFSYISKQRGRNIKLAMDYVNDKRYLSLRNLILQGSAFGLEFMFHELADDLLPFDYDVFFRSSQKFNIGVTNCNSGKAEFFSNKDKTDIVEVCKASCSMPFFSKEGHLYGTPYLDGGISAPIPLKRSIKAGNEKNIVVLTRNSDYRKTENKTANKLMSVMYKKYPKLITAYENRYKVYNETLDLIEKLEQEGKVFVIRPKKVVNVRRMENDKSKLKVFYEEGYNVTKRQYKELRKWILDKGENNG